LGPRGGGELTWIVSVQVVCLVTNSARLLSTRIKHSPIRIHKNMTSYTKRCLNNLNSQIVCLFLPFTVSVHCPTFLCRHYRVHYSTSLCRHYRECIIPLSSAGITESALFHFHLQALQRVRSTLAAHGGDPYVTKALPSSQRSEPQVSGLHRAAPETLTAADLRLRVCVCVYVCVCDMKQGYVCGCGVWLIMPLLDS